jgi:predicted phosphoribosyltransferase
VDVHGYTVILVDDGLATGSTMRAAIEALRQRQPGRIVVAAPVATASVCQELSREVDDIVCIIVPEELFYGIGFWYEDFAQITDEEVRNLLAQSRQERPSITHKP